MRTIILSELAGRKLDAILDYLMAEWSRKSSDEFLEKFEIRLLHVAAFPESCITSKRHYGLHLCVVTKQTSFLYRIKNDNLEVITVFDNRSKDNSIIKEIRKHYGNL